MKVMTEQAYRLFHDGAKTLAKIESNGIRIDVPYLKSALHDTAEQIRGLEGKLQKDEVWQRWVKRFGQRSNLGSLDQLGKILYGRKKAGGLGYECNAVTATGRPQVNESAIEKIDLPFCKDYIQLRRLQKARSTFLSGIMRETSPDGFLHPSLNMHLAKSYRTSSDKPNLQNMPVRNPMLLNLIRKCFIARPGHVLVEVDFSGIEVRIASCYNKDPNLIRYIEDPTTDMHRDAACKLALLRPEQVSKAMRHTAKNRFVFPQFYGSYYVDCATAIWEALERQDIRVEGDGVTVLEHLAKQGIQSRGACNPDETPVPDTFEHHVREVENWFWQTRFKAYTEWKQRWWNEYLRRGFFRSKVGFVYNGHYRRNQVLNLMIQGDASHCMIFSCIHINKHLEKRKMRSRIVNEVHDSIWIDAHESELQEVLTIAKYVMTRKLPKEWRWVIVPLETEAEVAPPGGSIADKKVWVFDKKTKLWGPK